MGTIRLTPEIRRDRVFGRGNRAEMARTISGRRRHRAAHDAARDIPDICAREPVAVEGSRRMNLTLHIVKKDLQRFWVPLALLSAVSLIRFGIGISLLIANDPEREWFSRMGIYANILWGIGLF